MTCRHTQWDSNCSSYKRNIEEAKAALLKANTPDPDNYEIEQIQRVGAHVVIKASYPSCAKCAYDGNKVMVFLNVTETDLLKWRKIDPHFRADKPASVKEAPSPAARFPASPEGWKDAIQYANLKGGVVYRRNRCALGADSCKAADCAEHGFDR